MSSQSIVDDSFSEVVQDLDKKITKDATDLLKKIRFSIGKGISSRDQFNQLYIREILCKGVCGLLETETDYLLDTLKTDLILNKQEYL